MSTIRHFRGEGNGTPLQYSCLENPMDRGAWWAAWGLEESDTTEWLHFHFSLACIGHQHCPLGGATLCCLWGLKAEAHAYLPAVRAWPSIGARRQGPGRRVDEGAAALCQPSRQPRHLPTPVRGSSRLAWAFCFLADQQGLQWTLPHHVQFGAGPRAAPRARK